MPSSSALAEEQQALPSEAIREFVTVLEQIKQNYVSPQTDEKLILDAINGMVSSLDDQSRYLDAKELAEFERAMTDSSGVRSAPTIDMVSGQLGYFKVPVFSPGSARIIRSAISRTKDLDGLIIDLRDNGGGLLEEAVNATDLFVSEGLIVRSRGRAAAANRSYSATPVTPFTDLPLVLIINEQTASAAEILAAALQDKGRAVVVGSRSYGKGSVQSLIYTSTGAIQITTSLNFRPSGEPIHEIGVNPNDDPLPNIVSKASMMHSSGNWQTAKDTASKADEADIQDHFIKEAVSVLQAMQNNTTKGAK